ncbi:hypothetical protein C7M61_001077 [Candidozyma pseudohaemuli]|uniref:GPI-anchored protein n=1 Tax=Candidozyma pseudohaemuli TaxID=418784 RepID=A0A2P7YZL8_9ASCO|nr:hypothetical protein C7M61_001077 [[Candida] pseudohaemulonii]PSK41395.1 hypothetical protein C7M61_001077 [[Candida] pseudohaemulonii]
MKFTFVSTLLCIFLAVTLATPIAQPVGEEFDLTFLEDTIEARFDPYDYEALSNFIQKRDTSGFEQTIEGLLNVVNDSGVIWAVLDQVAYYPDRIEFIANLTGRLIGGANLSSIGDMLGGGLLDLSDLNVSAIVGAVADSGVVQSLLDGILLDEDYRPNLVNLVSRLLKSQKNTFLWLVQDLFGRNSNSKRAETSGLETFIGNIISTALSSTLVADVAKDVLTALNNTQFLTTTVKHFLADEGYQNMTAQLVIDVMNTGAISLNGASLNVTSLSERVLSRPELISGAVGMLLSGNIQLGGLGKYADAVMEIVRGVEDDGTFAELNNYVFSESHTVSTPVLFTGTVVVPRTASFSLGGIGGFSNASATTTNSPNSRTTNSPSRTTSHANNDTSFSYQTDDNLNELESAAEVASILSLLSASPASETGSATNSPTSKTSESSGSPKRSATSSVDSLSRWMETYGAETTTTTSSRSSAPATTSSSRSYRSMVTVTVEEGSDGTTTADLSSGGGLDAILGFFTQTGSNNQRREVTQGSSASSKSVSMVLVYLQVFLFGGVLML